MTTRPRTRPTQIMVDRAADFLSRHGDEDLSVEDVSQNIEWIPELEADAYRRAKTRTLSDLLRRAKHIDETTGETTNVPRFGRYQVWFQTNDGKEKPSWVIKEWHLMDREQMRMALEVRDAHWKRSKLQMTRAHDHCNMLLTRWRQKPLKYGEFESDDDDTVSC